MLGLDLLCHINSQVMPSCFNRFWIEGPASLLWSHSGWNLGGSSKFSMVLGGWREVKSYSRNEKTWLAWVLLASFILIYHQRSRMVGKASGIPPEFSTPSTCWILFQASCEGHGAVVDGVPRSSLLMLLMSGTHLIKILFTLKSLHFVAFCAKWCHPSPNTVYLFTRTWLHR